MSDQENPIKSPFTRREDFAFRYANNVQFTVSIWDLTAIFGELTLSSDINDVGVQQHTAITMSWLQAKTMAAFLILNVVRHEQKHGAIAVPSMVLPPHIKQDEASLSALDMLLLAAQRARQELDGQSAK
jgi:hypothetical protein